MSRPRDDGIVIGSLAPGPRNSIADVGVRVGHVTVEVTGVTALVPPSLPLPAGTATLNGAGELTGAHEIREWGLLETPVYLTSTHAVGRVYDGAVQLAIASDPRVGVDDVVIPVVGECDDSWLSDARIPHVQAADVAVAVERASLEFATGAVGAGTGMSCFGWKGGIGTSSRRVGPHTVGVLLLTNFGVPEQLRIDGVPASVVPPEYRAKPAGSCIGVVATDAPLAPQDLERLARRVGLGLARAGSVAHNGSGEIFVAFATSDARTLRGRALDGLFQATVDASEEAVLDSLWAAVDTTGREGRTAYALPRGR
ncbi:MAG TPA: P1 family peptidase [Acidimicrobiales bacterium]|nr:P1 family peptidase [Acidimicrobiales bacterium]